MRNIRLYLIAVAITMYSANATTTITFDADKNNQNKFVQFNFSEKDDFISLDKMVVKNIGIMETLTVEIPGKIKQKQVCIAMKAFSEAILPNKIRDSFCYYLTNHENIFENFYKTNLRIILKFKDIEGISPVLPEYCTMLFSNAYYFTEIDFGNVTTKHVKNMYRMFENCINLTTINLKSFNTSQVNCMEGMFRNCTKLKKLNISHFNTGNVTHIGNMFLGCVKLEDIDVSKFDTSKVINMYGMFENCKSLKEIDVSKFDTRNVYTLSYMFKNCEKLKKIDISNFNTKNIEYAHSMCENCYELITVHLCKFGSKFNDAGEMFLNCYNLARVISVNPLYAHVFQNKAIFNGCINLIRPAIAPEQ